MFHILSVRSFIFHFPQVGGDSVSVSAKRENSGFISRTQNQTQSELLVNLYSRTAAVDAEKPATSLSLLDAGSVSYSFWSLRMILTEEM